ASSARTAGSLRSISGAAIASDDRDEDRERGERREQPAGAGAPVERGAERREVAGAVVARDALPAHVGDPGDERARRRDRDADVDEVRRGVPPEAREAV